jgi:hypothetical protein
MVRRMPALAPAAPRGAAGQGFKNYSAKPLFCQIFIPPFGLGCGYLPEFNARFSISIWMARSS